MTRFNWVLFKAIAAAALVGGAGLAAALKLKALESSPIFASLSGLAPWVAVAGIGGALLLLASPLWRIWAWSRGGGLNCNRCGGPLGGEVLGRHGLYRRCMLCNGANSARHYC
jgi:hypothetical protein